MAGPVQTRVAGALSIQHLIPNMPECHPDPAAVIEVIETVFVRRVTWLQHRSASEVTACKWGGAVPVHAARALLVWE